MNLQKEREAFERLPLAELAIKCKYVYYNEKTNSYWPNEDFCPSDAPETMNFAWEAWQAAIARMEVRINTLDEMLLNQGEALAQAKAQAVPEWISISERMPEEGEEVFVHNLGQVRQATRDSSFVGGFKERNCYGWQATYSQSHWMPKSIKLPEDYNFYYENDAKQKAMIEAQENS